MNINKVLMKHNTIEGNYILYIFRPTHGYGYGYEIRDIETLKTEAYKTQIAHWKTALKEGKEKLYEIAKKSK